MPEEVSEKPSLDISGGDGDIKFTEHDILDHACESYESTGYYISPNCSHCVHFKVSPPCRVGVCTLGK